MATTTEPCSSTLLIVVRTKGTRRTSVVGAGARLVDKARKENAADGSVTEEETRCVKDEGKANWWCLDSEFGNMYRLADDIVSFVLKR